MFGGEGYVGFLKRLPGVGGPIQRLTFRQKLKWTGIVLLLYFMLAQLPAYGISQANFESLSCFLSRELNRLVRRIWKRDLPSPHIWEIPKDHTHKFDYPSTLGLAGKYLQIESIRGVSLLWGFPRWANLLRRLPRPMALILLRSLDKIANWHPDWSDVLILVGRPNNHLPGKERSF